MLKEIEGRLKENEMTIEVSPEAKALIVKEGLTVSTEQDHASRNSKND